MANFFEDPDVGERQEILKMMRFVIPGIFVTALFIGFAGLPAKATDNLSVESKPQPEVGKSVLRETKPLSGTSAADVEVKLPPSEEGKSAPVVTTTPPPVTPEGKVVSGSTNITKTEDEVEDTGVTPVSPVVQP